MSVFYIFGIALLILILLPLVGSYTGRVLKSRSNDWCRCGHPVDWHEHLRDGDDCSICECRAFRAG